MYYIYQLYMYEACNTYICTYMEVCMYAEQNSLGCKIKIFLGKIISLVLLNITDMNKN